MEKFNAREEAEQKCIAAERKTEAKKKLREEAAARKKEQERIVRDKEPEKPPRVIIVQPTSTIEAQTIVNAINAM